MKKPYTKPIVKIKPLAGCPLKRKTIRAFERALTYQLNTPEVREKIKKEVARKLLIYPQKG